MSRSFTVRQLARTFLQSQPQSQPLAKLRCASRFNHPFSSFTARRADTSDGQPLDAQPTESRPIENQPSQSPSTESQPIQSQPSQVSSIESQPIESSSSASRPTGSQPTGGQRTTSTTNLLTGLLANKPKEGGKLSNLLANQVLGAAQNITPRVAVNTDVLTNPLAEALGAEPSEDEHEPYHFHIYATKHNTHVTVTRPNRDAIVSLSCGNLGFKKAQRSHYDSAYQLGAYVIDRLHQQNLHKKINKLEVILRGFGPGREAVTKVLLGNEGKYLRDKIIKVADSTRIKFGGTRSPKPRRLG